MEARINKNADIRIVVLDYGASNLRSVAKAFEKLGYGTVVSGSAECFDTADAIVLPGQGAAASTVNGLKSRGLIEPLVKFVENKRPFLGVCMGLQVLFEFSEEGDQECLGLVSGRVKRLPSDVKVPHIGWNQVLQKSHSPLFDSVPGDSYFYFVHSYYPVPDDSTLIIGETEYNITFCSAIAKGNVVATLFHPEKSGDLGLHLYDNFVKHWVMEEKWR